MTVVAALSIVCLTALVAQYRHHVYQGLGLESRLAVLEKRQAEAFDPKAFSELQSKVEALRIAKGLGR
jgi:hypothetical protein